MPEGEVDELLTDCIVHPWLVIQQGSDKWRACQDYKNGTNLFNGALPFNLPSVWSVKRVIKRGSFMAKYDVRDGFWHVPVKPSARRRLLVRHPTNGRLMRAARLPFGYNRSPEHFCMVTQEMADEFHRRYPKIGAHVFVFVDDFIVIGDDEAACSRACAALEELLAEFGIQWAPHKRRGPTQCIEFLGLLLCNVEGMRCIGLTEGRLDRVRRDLVAWRARKPQPGAGELRVDARELAAMLGHLVFVSQVVPGGRPAMMSMLSSFQGMVVDWKRGRVSVGGGEWRDSSVPAGFWEDLEWWEEHIETRHYTPMEEAERRPAVVAGTDASGWGQGGLVWLDGQREEIQLKFTDGERAHSINWRELLGVVRVTQAWGPRLRGMRLLVETDNMTAYEVGRRRRARVAAMQELVRRLVDTCEIHDIELALTHTPGVKLDRPDQTSRGDAVEEPRQRLGAELFGELAEIYGPFTEFIGGERSHPQARAQSAARVRLWLHPSHSMVGSALRLMTARLKDAGEGAEGVIVVPDESSAQWWSMTRYFSVEGRIRAGAEIQESRVGRWCPARTRRDALILRFPRTAGSVVRPVLDVRGEAPDYLTSGHGPNRLRMLPGSIVMRLGPTSSAAGVLPGASACWELFELRARWPDVAARGSWLAVARLSVVRETAAVLRLRCEVHDEYLNPEGGGSARRCSLVSLERSQGPARGRGTVEGSGVGDKLFCDSCDRGLHRECAQLNRTATLGLMRCPECRMAAMKVTQPVGPMVAEMCGRRMITELTSRLETTAQGHLGIERLQVDFLNARLDPGASMAKPMDNEESFCAMLEWIVSSGRGNRLESFLISVPAYCWDTHRPDPTKSKAVKPTMRKVREINPTKSLPKTTGTS